MKLSKRETEVLRQLTQLRHLDRSFRKYGLDLVKDSGGVLGRGTVYVHLHRMQEKGLVTSEPAPRPTDHPKLPPSRMYSATDLGEQAYLAHVGGETP